jgi:hypothetical protein
VHATPLATADETQISQVAPLASKAKAHTTQASPIAPKANNLHPASAYYSPNDRPDLESPPPDSPLPHLKHIPSNPEGRTNATHFRIDQYGTNLTLLSPPLGQQAPSGIPSDPPTNRSTGKGKTRRGKPTSQIPAQEKQKEAEATQPLILRRSQREAKQTQLYPGLIHTPTKTKPRQKATITSKALKLAIKKAGLTDKLTQATPLQAETVQQIRGFMAMPISADLLPPPQDSHTQIIQQQPSHNCPNPQPRLTLQDLGFLPSDEDLDYADDMALKGINIDDLDAYTEDEDLLDDVEDNPPLPK